MSNGSSSDKPYVPSEADTCDSDLSVSDDGENYEISECVEEGGWKL